MTESFESDPEASGAGDINVDDETQLQPEDTLVDRGVDDVLDEGYSPPDHEPAHRGRGAPQHAADQHAGTLGALRREGDAKPARRIRGCARGLLRGVDQRLAADRRG